MSFSYGQSTNVTTIGGSDEREYLVNTSLHSVKRESPAGLGMAAGYVHVYLFGFVQFGVGAAAISSPGGTGGAPV